MRKTTILLAVTLLAGGAWAKPKESVTYAPSWDAAVEEAKTLNIPIVVHSHGFYWGPCWGMHRSVMQNKKYIKFHEENTVEVIAMGRLQEGVDAEDPKTETYTAEDADGNEVEYLVEFPGLTLEQMLDLNRSKAGSFNNTGRIPYTCVVNPHTGEEMVNWSGGQSAKTIMEAVKEAKAKLEEEYGPSTSRKVLDKFREEGAEIREQIAEGDLWKALTYAGKLVKKAERYGPGVQKVATDLQAEALKATGARLDELEAMLGGEDAGDAERELKKLARVLEGTELEERANALLARAEGE